MAQVTRTSGKILVYSKRSFTNYLYLFRGNKNITISVVNVYFVVDSVHPIRRSARYSTFEEVGEESKIIWKSLQELKLL